jgi:hypothetical protein
MRAERRVADVRPRHAPAKIVSPGFVRTSEGYRLTEVAGAVSIIDPGFSPSKPATWPEIESFSLVLGGPLYQLLRKAHLEAESVEFHLLRRVVAFVLVTWLPLLVLTIVGGTWITGVDVPFIADVETHVRFLLVVPLFVLAELVVHRRMRVIVVQFVDRGLVPEAALARFHAALASAVRWRNSIPAELALLALVYSLGVFIRSDVLALQAPTWYAQPDDGVMSATTAGLWLQWVSNPLLQFLLLRWYYRIFVWARFLWQVSRIDLALMPTHPDRNCGLGFLGGSAYALSPLLMAHGAAVAGYAASLIFYQGASLAEFELEIVVLVALLLVVVVGPLTVFAPKILAAKRKGLHEYGVLAAEYARRFEQRWVRQPDHDGQALLGAADIQSLADLDGAVSIIKSVAPLPVSRETLFQLILATVLPFAPLLFTLFPLEELLNRIIGAVF